MTDFRRVSGGRLRLRRGLGGAGLLGRRSKSRAGAGFFNPLHHQGITRLRADGGEEAETTAFQVRLHMDIVFEVPHVPVGLGPEQESMWRLRKSCDVDAGDQNGSVGDSDDGAGNKPKQGGVAHGV